jgi:hypothetical protein
LRAYTLFELFLGIRLKIEENSRKTPIQGDQKVPKKERWHDSLCRLGHHLTGDLDWPTEFSHSLLALQVTLVKPRSA